MHTPSPFKRSITLGVPMLLIAMLTVQCSDSGSDADDEYNDADSVNAVMDGSNANINDDGSATNANNGGNSNGAATQGDMYPLYTGDRVAPATPEEERLMATSDMRGLRAILIADLEAVRARLNDGTQPEAQSKADQVLAADLAQGLERVDRALVALDASTETTWASMRENQLKEVSEVRAWMIDYRSKPDSRL